MEKIQRRRFILRKVILRTVKRRSKMETHLRKLWDSLTSSYWFVPLVMMAMALLLRWGTSTLDHVLSIRDKKNIAWLYSDTENLSI